MYATFILVASRCSDALRLSTPVYHPGYSSRVRGPRPWAVPTPAFNDPNLRLGIAYQSGCSFSCAQLSTVSVLRNRNIKPSHYDVCMLPIAANRCLFYPGNNINTKERPRRWGKPWRRPVEPDDVSSKRLLLMAMQMTRRKPAKFQEYRND